MLSLKGPAPHSIRLLRELCKDKHATPEYWQSVARLAASEIPRMSPVDTSLLCLFCSRTPAAGRRALLAAGLYDVLQAKLEQCETLGKWKSRDVAVALGSLSRLPDLALNVDHFRQHVKDHWMEFHGNDLAIALVALANKGCALPGVGHLKAAEMSMESLTSLASVEPDVQLAPFVKDNMRCATPKHASSAANTFAKINHPDGHAVMQEAKSWLFARIESKDLAWQPMAMMLNSFVRCKMQLTTEELTTLCAFMEANVDSLKSPQSLSVSTIALAHLGKGLSPEAAQCIEKLIGTPVALDIARSGTHGIGVKQMLDALGRTCAATMRTERDVQKFLFEVCEKGLNTYTTDLLCYIIRSLGTLYDRTSPTTGFTLRKSIEKAVAKVKEVTEAQLGSMPRESVRAYVNGLNSLRIPSIYGTRVLVAPMQRDAVNHTQSTERPHAHHEGPVVRGMNNAQCDEHSTPAHSSTADPERKRARMQEEDAVVALQALALVRAQQLHSACIDGTHDDDDLEPLWAAMEVGVDIDWKWSDALCKALASYCLARRVPPWIHRAAHDTPPAQDASLWDTARIVYYTTVCGWADTTNTIARLLPILQSSTEHIEPKKASQLIGYVAWVAAVHRNEGLLEALATWMRRSGATLCFFEDRWRVASAVCALGVLQPDFVQSVDLVVSNTKDLRGRDDDKTVLVADMFRDVSITLSNVLSASHVIRQQTAVLYHLDLVILPER